MLSDGQWSPLLSEGLMLPVLSSIITELVRWLLFALPLKLLPFDLLLLPLLELAWCPQPSWPGRSQRKVQDPCWSLQWPSFWLLHDA